ncbi:MAG: dipeptidase [Oscillospiraceae bacterium]
MKYSICDAHCDTIFEVFEQEKDLRKNTLHLDLESMKEYEKYVQVFAAFVDKTEINCSPLNHCLKLVQKYHQEVEKNLDIMSHCDTYSDILKATNDHKIASVLSIEGGEALDGNISALWMFYKLGVRLITLTWNHANEIADGITQSRGGGLTEFGREVVQKMNEFGMIVDVSHLSENGFWDVAEISKKSNKPFIASHSCAKAICPHPRNLSDEQIRAIIECDGFIGINFYSEFLTTNKECGIANIIEHIQYMLTLDASRNIGFGSDFDGIDILPHGMSGTKDVKSLVDMLILTGMSEVTVNNICYNNFMRVLAEILL